MGPQPRLVYRPSPLLPPSPWLLITMVIYLACTYGHIMHGGSLLHNVDIGIVTLKCVQAKQRGTFPCFSLPGLPPPFLRCPLVGRRLVVVGVLVICVCLLLLVGLCCAVCGIGSAG